MNFRVWVFCVWSLLVARPSVAQVTAGEEDMVRVEVIGSSIKRLVSESSQPLTVFKAEEFTKQGLTTAREVLDRIPSNQTNMGAGNTIGGNASSLPTGGQAVADLRGLGGDKTLVLLNGRRIANHPYDSASVDLNLIPIAALERVEVLRDGASAIYGTDAIGGVINFITRRSVRGTTLVAESVIPKKSGGKEKRANIISGIGELDADGWSVFGVLDYHNEDALTSQQREFSNTGVRNNLGLSRTSGVTFPGNYFDPVTKTTGNPGYPSGCNAPFSLPIGSGGTCRQDYTRQIDDLPEQEQLALFGRATKKFGDHTASLEYLHSRNKVISHTAPPPQIALFLPKTSPYYPGNSGGVPAQPNLSGEPLNVSWRPLEAGQRQINSEGEGDRLVAALEGLVAGWDYKGGLSHSINKSEEVFAGGYVQDSGFAAGVLNGILNPFGLQNSAGKAYLESVALRGKVQDAKATTTAFDLKASRELIRLSGGPLAMALGAEIRHEKSDFNVNRDIAGQAGSSGLSGSLSKNGSRNIKAVFGELSIPVMKKVDVQAAMRYDDYDDVGRTANPKVGVRWQPSPRIMLRGSASTGFRAPTLFERNAPQSRNETNNSLNDPILCPSGVPQPGANPLRDCGLQQFKLQGGNPDLTPEKSKTFSVGAVIEPASNLTVAIDYWAISLKDKIGNVPELTLFGNFERYRARFLRNPDGSPFAVLDLYENLGKVRTNGVDLSLTGTTRHMDYGDFSLKIDGTWVHKYEYQNERDGDYIQNVGRYADLFPIFRWKHNLSLTWRSTTWSATLSQNFRTGYVDQNQVDPILFNRVSSYQLWNLSGTYAASKSLTLTAGIKNLFDRDPPFTNQGSTFQQGYDPRFTDPGGRALYLRGSVDF